MTDSVSIDALAEAAGEEKDTGAKKHRGYQAPNLKMLAVMFLWFIVVVSDFFTNNVIAGFGEKAVKGRSPTSWGVVLQGIFLVVGYAIWNHLLDHGVL